MDKTQRGSASLLIVLIILAVFSASGMAYLALKEEPRPAKKIVPLLSFNQNLSSLSCAKWHNNIEEAFVNDNYCEQDSDCQAIPLGGRLIAFGCVHYLNKGISSTTVYSVVEAYTEKCTKMINDCDFVREAVCQNNKCVAQENLVV